MFIEALVLDGDLGIYHFLGNVLEAYPYSVFGRVELPVILPFAFFVKNVNMARLVQLQISKVDI